MALNSSGPISLGGSVVGQSINLELDLVSNAQVSMNDLAVRKLAGLETTMTPISIPGDFWGKSSVTYWISYISTADAVSTADAGVPLEYDADENIYTVIGSGIVGDYALVKLNNLGQFVSSSGIKNAWSKNTGDIYDLNLYNGSLYFNARWPNSATYDLGVLGAINATTMTWPSPFLAKAGTTGVEDRAIPKLVINKNNGYKYLGWTIQVSSDEWLIVLDSSDSGVAQGVSTISADNKVCIPDFDTSNNVYFGIVHYVSTTAATGSMYKYSADLGTAIQNRRSSDSRFYGNALIDTTNRVWNVSYGATQSTSVHGILKTNSDLNEIWFKTLNIPASAGNTVINGANFKTICVDSESNVYAITKNITDRKLVLYKRNSSGTLLWQRNISISNGTGSYLNNVKLMVSETAIYIRIDSIIPTPTSDKNWPMVFKLPKDGSGTGTYTLGTYTITYEISSYTESNQTVTWTTAGGFTVSAVGSQGTLTSAYTSSTISPSATTISI